MMAASGQLVTPNLDFKVTMFFSLRSGRSCCHAASGWVDVCLSRSCIVSKRLKIRSELLRNVNRKL